MIPFSRDTQIKSLKIYKIEYEIENSAGFVALGASFFFPFSFTWLLANTTGDSMSMSIGRPDNDRHCEGLRGDGDAQSMFMKCRYHDTATSYAVYRTAASCQDGPQARYRVYIPRSLKPATRANIKRASLRHVDIYAEDLR